MSIPENVRYVDVSTRMAAEQTEPHRSFPMMRKSGESSEYYGVVPWSNRYEDTAEEER